MSALSPSQRLAQHARSSAWWLVPALALAVLIGWEIDWGRHLLPEPPPPVAVAAKPVEAAVLPEYRLEGGLVARNETVNRTLFNPTRRPAPVLASAGPRRIQPGQFVLVGTTVSGEQKIAFLKETNGGRAHTVRQGDQINGMEVALVAADHVRLAAGGDAEELTLKVAKGPKTTLQPAPPAPVAAATAAEPAAAEPAAPPPAVTGRPASGEETAAARRDARRAAASTAGGPASATGNVAPPKPDQSAPPGSWESVYENMRRNRQQQQ